MGKSAWAIVVVIVLILIVGGFLVLGKNNSATAPTATVSPAATETTQTTPEPTAMTENASSSAESASNSAATSQNLEVSGSEFAYTPKVLTSKVGQPVTVTFKNDGQFPHNFTITELDVASKTIQPGQSTTVTFTPTKAGEYKFFCSVDSHEAKGMVGTLTVQ